jgi:hypothetical protein
MAKTEQSKQEAESIIRWSEADDMATLWTGSAATRKVWESYGFPMRVDGGGWRGEVAVDRLSYKPIRQKK